MARETIQDEFTDLPISRQQKHMLRKKKAGKCILCKRKQAPGHDFCGVHLKKKRIHDKERRAELSKAA